MLLALLALGLCLSGAQAGSDSVLLVDSRQNAYLQRQEGSTAVSQTGLQGIIAALTGLQPAAPIDQAAAQQIAAVVKASPLSKPQAHVSLTLAGLSPEELATLLEGRSKVSASLQGQQQQEADEVLAHLAEANPDVAFQLLEEFAAQRCDRPDAVDSCLAQLMPAVATALGGEFNADTNTLALADGTQLDLLQLTDKAFALELAAVAGVQDLLQSRQSKDVLVMDLSMLALQGLADKYGQGSAEAVAGKAAALSMLQWALQRLDSHFEGDVTMQVSSMGADSSVRSLDDALAWKSQRHARMLQAVIATATDTKPSWLQGNETLLAQRFSVKAAAFGSFILLLYFLLLGTYCLCYMPFQRDTMLFGAKKND